MNLMLETTNGRHLWVSALVACLGLLGGACAPNDISGTDGQSGFVSGGDHDELPDGGSATTLAESPDSGLPPTEAPNGDPPSLLPEAPDDGSPLFEQEGVPEVLHGELRPSSLRCVGDDEDRELLPWLFQAVLQRNGNTISGQIWGLPARSASDVTGNVIPSEGRFSATNLVFPHAGGAASAFMEEFVVTDLTLDADRITGVFDPQDVELWGETDEGDSCTLEGIAVLTRDTAPPTPQVLEQVGGYSELIVGFDEPVRSDGVLDVQVDGESFSVTRTDVEVTGTDGLISEMHLVAEAPWPYGEITLVMNGVSDVAGNTIDTEVPALLPEYEPANIDPSFELTTRNGSPWWLAPLCEAQTYEPDPTYGPQPTEGSSILSVYCLQNGLLFQQPINVPAGATQLLIDVDAFLPLEMHLHLRSASGQVELQLQGEVTDPEMETLLTTYAAPLDTELGTTLWLTAEIEFENVEPYTDGTLYLDNLRFE